MEERDKDIHRHTGSSKDKDRNRDMDRSGIQNVMVGVDYRDNRDR